MDRTRLTPRGWVVLVIIPLLLLATTLWLGLRGTGWKLIEHRGQHSQWAKDGIVHVDFNGDRVVDEETILAPPPRLTRVRRDTDLDGWFDIEYELGPHGIAINLRQIREKAPRH